MSILYWTTFIDRFFNPIHQTERIIVPHYFAADTHQNYSPGQNETGSNKRRDKSGICPEKRLGAAG